jgi:hypothetical protein
MIFKEAARLGLVVENMSENKEESIVFYRDEEGKVIGWFDNISCKMCGGMLEGRPPIWLKYSTKIRGYASQKICQLCKKKAQDFDSDYCWDCDKLIESITKNMRVVAHPIKVLEIKQNFEEQK